MASVSVRRTGGCAAAGTARTAAAQAARIEGSKGVHDTATLLMNTSSSDAGTSPDAGDRHLALPQPPLDLRRGGPASSAGPPHVDPLAEALRVGHARQRAQRLERLALRPREDLDDGARQALAERLRRVDHEQPAVREQRDARAPLGLVEVRRRHDDGDALGEELGQQLPELAARHRVHARRRLVEQDDLRLVDERAGERELLLHAARQPVGQPVAERRELRHVEQAVAPRLVVASGRGSRRRTRCSRRC